MKAVLTLLVLCAVASSASADHLAALIESADSAKILFHTGKKDEKVLVTDRKWLHQFAVAVDGAAGWWKLEPCLCVSYPEAKFFREEKQILSLSIPHGSRLRCYSEKKFRSGDFSVTKERARQILSMLMTQKPANQAPEPTPTTVTPPAGRLRKASPGETQEARQP